MAGTPLLDSRVVELSLEALETRKEEEEEVALTHDVKQCLLDASSKHKTTMGAEHWDHEQTVKWIDSIFQSKQKNISSKELKQSLDTIKKSDIDGKKLKQYVIDPYAFESECSTWLQLQAIPNKEIIKILHIHIFKLFLTFVVIDLVNDPYSDWKWTSYSTSDPTQMTKLLSKKLNKCQKKRENHLGYQSNLCKPLAPPRVYSSKSVPLLGGLSPGPKESHMDAVGDLYKFGLWAIKPSVPSTSYATQGSQSCCKRAVTRFMRTSRTSTSRDAHGLYNLKSEKSEGDEDGNSSSCFVVCSHVEIASSIVELCEYNRYMTATIFNSGEQRVYVSKIPASFEEDTFRQFIEEKVQESVDFDRSNPTCSEALDASELRSDTDARNQMANFQLNEDAASLAWTMIPFESLKSAMKVCDLLDNYCEYDLYNPLRPMKCQVMHRVYFRLVPSRHQMGDVLQKRDLGRGGVSVDAMESKFDSAAGEMKESEIQDMQDGPDRLRKDELNRWKNFLKKKLLFVEPNWSWSLEHTINFEYSAVTSQYCEYYGFLWFRSEFEAKKAVQYLNHMKLESNYRCVAQLTVDTCHTVYLPISSAEDDEKNREAYDDDDLVSYESSQHRKDFRVPVGRRTQSVVNAINPLADKVLCALSDRMSRRELEDHLLSVSNRLLKYQRYGYLIFRCWSKQRAVTIKNILQDIVDTMPTAHGVTPRKSLTTMEFLSCRQCFECRKCQQIFWSSESRLQDNPEMALESTDLKTYQIIRTFSWKIFWFRLFSVLIPFLHCLERIVLFEYHGESGRKSNKLKPFLPFWVIILYSIVLWLLIIEQFFNETMYHKSGDVTFVEGVYPLLFASYLTIFVAAWCAYTPKMIYPSKHTLLHLNMSLQYSNTLAPTVKSAFRLLSEHGIATVPKPYVFPFHFPQKFELIHLLFLLLSGVLPICGAVTRVMDEDYFFGKWKPIKKAYVVFNDVVLYCLTLSVLYIFNTIYVRIQSYFKDVTFLSNLIVNREFSDASGGSSNLLKQCFPFLFASRRHPYTMFLPLSSEQNQLAWYACRAFIKRKGGIILASLEMHMILLLGFLVSFSGMLLFSVFFGQDFNHKKGNNQDYALNSAIWGDSAVVLACSVSCFFIFFKGKRIDDMNSVQLSRLQRQRSHMFMQNLEIMTMYNDAAFESRAGTHVRNRTAAPTLGAVAEFALAQASRDRDFHDPMSLNSVVVSIERIIDDCRNLDMSPLFFGQKLNRVGWEVMLTLLLSAGSAIATKLLQSYFS